MIKSQYAGGILLQPVQTLVATIIFARLTEGQKCKRVPSGVPKREGPEKSGVDARPCDGSARKLFPKHRDYAVDENRGLML